MSGHIAKMFHPSTVGVIFTWLLLGFIPFICGILLIVAHYYYYQYRDMPFIKKRHPFLVIIGNSCLIIILMIQSPLSIINHINTFSYSPFWLQFLNWIIFTTFVKCSIIAFALRVYLFYFDVNWTKASNCQQWHHFIDTLLMKQNDNWFIINHSTWGNVYFLRKYAIIFLLFIILFSVSIVLINNKYIFYASTVDNIIVICLPIYVIIVWLKTPVFYDEFLIRKEIKGNVFVLILINILYVQFNIIGLMGYESFVSWLITIFISVLLIIAFASIPLIWVFINFKQYSRKRRFRHLMNNDGYVELNEDMNSIQSYVILNIDIMDILKTEDGFNAFMVHLGKEFSMENLLSIIEMTQFKKRYRQIIKYQKRAIKYRSREVKKHLKSKSMINIREEIIRLPAQIPKSTIVYRLDIENEDENREYLVRLDRKIEAQRMIKLLMEKYIQVDGDLQLNLSFIVRKRMMKEYEQLLDMSDIELEHIFDQCMERMLHLMQDSYVRFKETPEFLNYEHKVQDKIIFEQSSLMALEKEGLI